MGERGPALTTWTLATFDASLFVLSAVLVAHASGALGDLLRGLNTSVGVVVFCYLWILFVCAVWWVLSGASLGESSVGTLAIRGVAAGGAVGVVFLLSGVLVLVLQSLGRDPLPIGSVAFIALVGAGVAAVVGAVVGLVASLLNVAAFRAAGAVLPAAEGPGTGAVPTDGDGDADRAS